MNSQAFWTVYESLQTRLRPLEQLETRVSSLPAPPRVQDIPRPVPWPLALQGPQKRYSTRIPSTPAWANWPTQSEPTTFMNHNRIVGKSSTLDRQRLGSRRKQSGTPKPPAGPSSTAAPHASRLLSEGRMKQHSRKPSAPASPIAKGNKLKTFTEVGPEGGRGMRPDELLITKVQIILGMVGAGKACSARRFNISAYCVKQDITGRKVCGAEKWASLEGWAFAHTYLHRLKRMRV